MKSLSTKKEHDGGMKEAGGKFGDDEIEESNFN